MEKLNSLSIGLASLASVVISGMATANAAVIDLGFALDRSGSVGSSNWSIIVNGLADALNEIPLNGPDQYNISVVGFSDSASTIVFPTILTAANLTTVQNQIVSAPFTAGPTCVSCATELLTSNLAGNFGDTSIMNISSDGVPNVGQTNGTTLRTDTINDGWDAISAEAIGNFDIGFFTDLVAPQPPFITSDPNNLPDPRTQGFVLEIASFEDYAPTLESKVAMIAGPSVPEPGTVLGLLAVGGLGLGLKRKRES